MNEEFLTKDKKRAKLRELLRNRPRGTKTALAKYCHVTFRAPQNWIYDGKAWPPAETEARMWEFFRLLDAPPTLNAPSSNITVSAPQQKQTASDHSSLVEQLQTVLHLRSDDPAHHAKLERIRAHLAAQIALFLELLMEEHGLVAPTRPRASVAPRPNLPHATREKLNRSHP